MGYKFNPFTGNLDVINSQASSNIITMAVNENISATKIVSANGYLADKDTANYRAIGIATQFLSGSGLVQIDGVFEDSSFLFTPNQPLFLQNNGGISHTAPTSGKRVKVGTAIASNSFKLELQSEIVTII